MRTLSFVLLLVCACAQLATADFLPIALTPETYNQDIVVEKSAPGPVVPVTTASMEAGTNNTGFSWYEKSYNANSQATGLPKAGTTTTGEADMEHEYQFAADYRSNNVVLLDNDIPAGTLFLNTPAAYARFSILTSSGNGSAQVAYAVHHQDGAVETGSFVSPDWFGPAGQAVTAYGRVHVQSFVFAGVREANPRLYACDLSLSNVLSPVTNIAFTHISGGHAAIFALSGAVAAGEPYGPAAVTGFNYDIVVEATANRPERVATATSATMEAGTANLARTWYESGYVPTLPGSGLPAPGSLLTNATTPAHVYRLPETYKGNNAVLIDAVTPEATLTPVTPSAFSIISFLCASTGGPVTNNCRVDHADGTDELSSIVVPDWMAAGPSAYDAGGRVNIDTRFPDFPAGGGPRLFSVDLAVTNTTAITNVALTFPGGAASGARCVFLALSGSTGVAVAAPRLSISWDSPGRLSLSTTAAGTLQSTENFQGASTVWQDEGPISGTLTITADAPAKWYRVRGAAVTFR